MHCNLATIHCNCNHSQSILKLANHTILTPVDLRPCRIPHRQSHGHQARTVYQSTLYFTMIYISCISHHCSCRGQYESKNTSQVFLCWKNWHNIHSACAFMFTHWPQGDVAEIWNMLFSKTFLWLTSWAVAMKSPSVECCSTLLMIKQYWFR